jgi:hypothetical protein
MAKQLIKETETVVGDIPHQCVIVIKLLGEIHKIMPDGHADPRGRGKIKSSTLHEIRTNSEQEARDELVKFRQYMSEKINDAAKSYRESNKGV